MTIILDPDQKTLQPLAFDGTQSEMHTFEGELTEEAVEDGSVFNDHFKLLPQTFECDVIMTMTPHRITAEGEGQVLPLQLSFPIEPPGHGILWQKPIPLLPPSVNTLQFPGMPDRIRRQLDALLALQTGVVPMSIFTDRHVYDSMILLKISETNESRWTGKFHLTFKRISVATTEQVAAPKPKEPRGTPGANKGGQEPFLSQFGDQAKNYLSSLKTDSILYGFFH